MKIENSIGWCDETGNKVTGCDKVSPGCKNCYAQVGTRARVLRAQGIETWGSKGQRYPVKDFASKVRRLNKLCVCDKCHESIPFACVGRRHDLCAGMGTQCQGTFRRIRLFADSNSDWLDDKWPIETLADLLKDIHDCPNVDFQLLTKRPENWYQRINAAMEVFPDGDPFRFYLGGWRNGDDIPRNVWIGVSVEDQKRADERIPLLLQIPAKVRFLSVEPLLEKVNLDAAFSVEEFIPGSGGDPEDSLGETEGVDWVIVGGESGPQEFEKWTHCKFDGARLKRDHVGQTCPTRNCQWEHGFSPRQISGRRDCGVDAIVDVARQCVAAGVPCFVKQASAFKPGLRGDLPDGIWNLKQFPTKESGQLNKRSVGLTP